MVFKGRIILRPTPMSRKISGNMKKMFGLWKKDKISDPLLLYKRKNQPSIATEGFPAFVSNTTGMTNTHITRRQIVLNRHFTEIISDVLANNFGHQLADMEVMITSIETKAWNKGVDVFYSTDRLFDKSLHSELNSLISQLRLAIGQRDLIGRVPPITFLHDRSDQLERTLNRAMDSITLQEPGKEDNLVKVQSSSLSHSKKSDQEQPELSPADFAQRPDLNNSMLGLDYPMLYNRVVSGLERGRAVSSRMQPVSHLAPIKPFFKEPDLKTEPEDDATTRIIKMKNFIINRRKKTEYQAKLKRKTLLMERDQNKWYWPDEDDCVEDSNQEQ